MTSGIVVFTAASGERSARLDDGRGGGIALFSVYDPRREAERFVAGQLRDRPLTHLVILGAGLGYLEAAAETAVPRAGIIPVYFADELAPEGAGHDDDAWRPGNGESIELFFERVLRGCDPRAVEVLEWPAAGRAFPELSRRARDALLRVLKENAYGDLTAAASGRRWLRNTLENFLLLDAPVAGRLLDPTLPLVIAAAGPSLDAALPLLVRHRDRVNLWALASALKALRSRGLEPDLTVATDAGYYASHLLLHSGGGIPLLAMPLSGAREAWRAADRVFLFAQPNFFELELFARSETSVPAVDAHGTVAGTALFLARAGGAATVFFCGLDCSYDDIRSHAAPHPYDELAARAATRFLPAYAAAFSRAHTLAPRRLGSGRARSSEALSVYSGSFREPCHREGFRVFRLFPSPVDVPGMKNAGPADFERAARAARGPRQTPALQPLAGYPAAASRKRIVRRLLDDWLAEIGTGRPRSELADFFAGVRPDPDGGKAERLAAAAGFLETLRERFVEEWAHA
ncbi:MAG: DUF115 domain-containing protein [Spirochaetales bacterium]|nr:DUF115 domain-containing protein [Spirochaetales bacterium]